MVVAAPRCPVPVADGAVLAGAEAAGAEAAAIPAAGRTSAAVRAASRMSLLPPAADPAPSGCAGPSGRAARRDAGRRGHGSMPFLISRARHPPGTAPLTVSSQREFAHYAMLQGRLLSQALPRIPTLCSNLSDSDRFIDPVVDGIEGQGRRRPGTAEPAERRAPPASGRLVIVTDSQRCYTESNTGGAHARHGQAIREAGRGLAIISEVRAPLAQLAEQQTLNLRVRGSSPWRRTHSDLGLYPFQALSCRPFPGHGCSMVARQSGPSRWDRANLPARGPRLSSWSIPFRLSS